MTCCEESDLPFHTETLPPKILPMIASDSASEFRWQLALNANPALVSGLYTKIHHSPADINDSFILHTCICNLKKGITLSSLDQDNQVYSCYMFPSRVTSTDIVIVKEQKKDLQ